MAQAVTVDQVWQGDGTPRRGEYGGACSTYTCPNTGADWHDSGGKYYCDACARELNEACLAQGTRKFCQLRV